MKSGCLYAMDPLLRSDGLQAGGGGFSAGVPWLISESRVEAALPRKTR